MCAPPPRRQFATTAVRGVLSFTGTAPAREKGGASQARPDAGVQDGRPIGAAWASASESGGAAAGGFAGWPSVPPRSACRPRRLLLANADR